ncbi:OB-fold nucleic acid binding domain-containing protein [Streptomyces sp. R-74717]|uniref:OB-fold nucleic acid binding domain-containing protein n=1 Tax=Streptomyces TaxID=1883 RepID=UPI003799D9F0
MIGCRVGVVHAQAQELQRTEDARASSASAPDVAATFPTQTIVELLASGRNTGDVQLSGLITGIQLKMTKQGNAWAIVNLADLDAGIEVLFFPAAYQFVQHALAEDNVISVKGKIEDRDGTVSVFGRELAVLDVSSAEHGGSPPCGLPSPPTGSPNSPSEN